MPPATPSAEPFELRLESSPDRVVRGRAVYPGEPEGAPATSHPWVLVLHGFKGFMDWGFFPLLAERLAGAGIASVLFNTSGSGIGPDLESFTEQEAFARATLSRQLEDIERVRAHALSGALRGLDPARAGLFGHSRGGGLGLVHAAEAGGYRALVTWAALDDADRYDDASKVAWRRDGSLPIVNSRTGQVLRLDVEVLDDFEANRARFDIPAACGRLAAPTLLLYGSGDESVHPSALGRLWDALPNGEAHLVPGAGHTFGAVHPLPRDPHGPAGGRVGLADELELALGKTVAWFARWLQGNGRT